MGEDGLLSGKNILTEHYRLHSDMAILSRSFCDTSKITDIEQIKRIFTQGMKEIRDYEQTLTTQSAAFFEANHQEVIRKVREIVEK